MPANFNAAALYYDKLSRLVYGSALMDAQMYLLQHIRDGDKILIVGGGTGAILEKITERFSSGLAITYVEIAEKMMALSQQRNVGNNVVTFINKGIEDVPVDNSYDVVITPFLFDNFTEETFRHMFAHIDGFLRPNGLCLSASFQQTDKWWQRLLLQSMFTFFRLVCNIEGSQLPKITEQFAAHKYALVDERTFFRKFVLASVYKKQ